MKYFRLDDEPDLCNETQGRYVDLRQKAHGQAAIPLGYQDLLTSLVDKSYVNDKSSPVFPLISFFWLGLSRGTAGSCGLNSE